MMMMMMIEQQPRREEKKSQVNGEVEQEKKSQLQLRSF